MDSFGSNLASKNYDTPRRMHDADGATRRACLIYNKYNCTRTGRRSSSNHLFISTEECGLDRSKDTTGRVLCCSPYFGIIRPIDLSNYSLAVLYANNACVMDTRRAQDGKSHCTSNPLKRGNYATLSDCDGNKCEDAIILHDNDCKTRIDTAHNLTR
jgi:hypothetical protein